MMRSVDMMTINGGQRGNVWYEAWEMAVKLSTKRKILLWCSKVKETGTDEGKALGMGRPWLWGCGRQLLDPSPTSQCSFWADVQHTIFAANQY